MAMQLPSSSSNSSFSDGFKFDVFISFRGPDTRYGFTGNLYKALSDKGIHTFIDDKELQRGDEITPSLLKSIEDSRIAIIVFSKNYASSSFCLDELAHIIHHFKEKGRLVLPVFYGVEPTDVRHQSGSYAEHLTKHEEKSMVRLPKWKEALSQAANLSGHHIKLGMEYEHKSIEKIVKDVSNKINHVPLHVADYPVGLESRISKVSSLLDLGSNVGVCIIGILGTGGMGKTTLAQAVHNLIFNQFEGVCFLHNVRENSVKHGLEYLQEQLLSESIGFEKKVRHINKGITTIKKRLCKKKVLLILDDIDTLKQLQVLVGKPGWLGNGSRVIITTRDKHLLSSHGVNKIYEADGLNKEQALELLRFMAFKSNKYDSSYDSILNRAAAYASGLPLALEVVGSNLFGRSIAECESLLDKYERIPHEDILKILKVSFDALDGEQQSVFLDIACCLKGYKSVKIEKILHAHYDYCIKIHLRVLFDKSLIKIDDDDDVTLHDLLEDMGKEIVRKESPNKPGERSRLWSHDDIVQLLKENMGTSKIEMIHLGYCSMETVIKWNGKAFKNMTNLKTLIIESGNFSIGPMYLPSSLRLWEWKECPLKSLSSCISNKEFNYMKVLTLNDCKYLIHIPNVSGLRNLKKFSFQYCENLITIHNSIGNLNKLEILNAKCCTKLESFPPLRLPSLKKLKLSDCLSLKSFPELLCKMTNIKKIELCDTSIEEFPFSFQNLSELREFAFNGGGNVKVRYPEHNDKMYYIVFSKLEFINLENNNLSDECLPIVLKWCVNLKDLYLSNSNFKILHECLSECHYLTDLRLDGCKFLEEIRGIPPNLNYLDARGCNFKILPECLSECHHLRELALDGCKFLEEIRGFPPNLKGFSAIGCVSLSSLSRRMLLSQKLHAGGCTLFRFQNKTEPIGIPDWFEHKSRRHSISFWFRKKIPSITSILLLPIFEGEDVKVNLIVNGYGESLDILGSEEAYLFDLELEKMIKRYKLFQENLGWKKGLDEALLKNEWIHVEINLYNYGTIKFSAEMGIHVWKEKINTEEDVIFTDPYSRKRKSDEDSNASLQQKKRKQNKFSILMDFQRKMWVQQKELMWGTFLGIGASKSNTEGNDIEILSNGQMEEVDDFRNKEGDEIEMWGTFLGLGAS